MANFKHILLYAGLEKLEDILAQLKAENPLIPLAKEGTTIYERVHSYFWKGEGTLVWSVSKSKPPSIEGYNIELECQNILAFTKGEKLNVIADIGGTPIQSKKERDENDLSHTKVIDSIAISTKNPLVRMTAYLFIRLKSPRYPAKVFSKLDAAIAWNKNFFLKANDCKLD
jgi:hypothetical protein